MRTFGVDGNPMSLIIRHVNDFIDCMNGTCWDTGATIDAYVGIDVGAFLVRVETLHRAHRDTIREATEMAIICDDVRHPQALSFLRRG
jgi:hypothetical protein